jgi:hypothetical protein
MSQFIYAQKRSDERRYVPISRSLNANGHGGTIRWCQKFTRTFLHTIELCTWLSGLKNANCVQNVLDNLSLDQSFGSGETWTEHRDSG